MTEAAGMFPTAQGSLAKTPLVHLLVYLADRQFSGSLVLAEPGEAAGQEHTIYFSGGVPAKFKTGKPVAHLGRVLFELGHLSEAALNQSLAAIAGLGELHGEYLVRTGAIDRSKLMTALRAQATRKMAFLFGLPNETSFSFYQDLNLLEKWGGPELTALEPLVTIWGGVRARGDDPVVDAMLSRLGATTLKLHEKNDAGRFGFSPQEMAVIDLIRARPCSLATLIETGVAPQRTIELIVYALLVTRHLDHGANSALPVGVQQRPAEPAPPREHPSSANVPLARVKLAARSPDAPPESSRGGAAPAAAARVSSWPAPKPVHSSSVPPRSLSPELAARREQIVKRADAIDRETYFDMLGVGRDASAAEVQTSYYALAKVWHPDRLPAELASVRDLASKVFARISEAFEALSDPEKRKRYLDVMKGGGGTPEEAAKIQTILDAAADFQRAEILWKKNDPNAEEYAARAYRSDPDQADYVALFALIQLSKRPPDAPVDDLMKLCDRAIAMHERCERGHFCRGMLKKRIGKVDSAMSDFRAAYEINPKNLDAAREVRLYEMRRAKHPDRQSGPPQHRSNPPTRTKSNPTGPRSSIPPRKTAPPPKKDGVLSGIGKLFKR